MSKLGRFKEGIRYAFLFIGINIIITFIFDYKETSLLFYKLTQENLNIIGVVLLTCLVVWIVIGFIIGVGLITFDYLKKSKKEPY